jgi:hypothetical protein
MKYINRIILLFAFVIVAFGCSENENLVGQRGVAVIPEISDIYPTFFNILDIENAYVQFTVDTDQEVSDAILEISFNGNSARVKFADLTSFPSTFTITASEAAAVFGISLDDLELGDMFLFEPVITANGVTTRSNSIVNANVACASDLAGTYDLVATGSSPDYADPWTPTQSTVTITSVDGGVTYSITPALGGMIEDLYSMWGGDIRTGTFQDICGNIENTDVSDGWEEMTYEGSIDPVTGVISITFSNTYGDSGSMTLTPQ